MITRILIFKLLIISYLSAAQTVPYYQLPQERTEKGERTFPNLKAKSTKFFIRPEGGMHLQGNSIDTDLQGKLIVGKQTVMNWGASLGFNSKDKWLVDIGYQQTPLTMSSSLKLSPFLVPFGPTKRLHNVSMQFQQELWTIDPISRSTRLYIGGGLLFPINGKAAEIYNRTQTFLQPTASRNLPDTIRLTNKVMLANIPVQAAIVAEIRGKIVEELEIGAYVKYQTSFRKPLSSEIIFQRNQEAAMSSIQWLSSSVLRIGVSIHYNFGIITNYESDIR